ncbi:hypothetical protein Nocox_29185 [Nonomuraea coxensis DSM 45129]|uniref:Uncharacterized protein n=1 Tax=Nonomuraea coxensis DSM 45129 TaxID=1122611 RepID=A0ABX8U7L7_9ACTN|nr:hypothetical protein [Nonomuraea coxensis]QYC43421.1 hypothetical protein Nocox_29185 [Nonomuraea coxensis DSM 45129]
MSEHDTYTITAGKSGPWWALTVRGPGLKRGYHTQVKRLEHAEEMARDLVATMLDVDVSEIDADFELTVADEDVATELEATLLARLAARVAKQQAAEVTQTTVADLARRGYVHRDIGYLLGISHQAVGKLLHEADKETAASALVLSTHCPENASRIELLRSLLPDVAEDDPAPVRLRKLRAWGERLRDGAGSSAEPVRGR